jgi:hypothetical protein
VVITKVKRQAEMDHLRDETFHCQIDSNVIDMSHHLIGILARSKLDSQGVVQYSNTECH